MTALNVYQQLHTVLGNRQQGRRQLADNRTLRQLQPLFFTHRDVATIVDSAVRKQGLQRADNRCPLVFGTGAQQLQYKKVAKTIDGHARQAVGLTGYQAIAIEPVAGRQPLAPGLRLLQATFEKGVINGFIAIEAPDAGADL